MSSLQKFAHMKDLIGNPTQKDLFEKEELSNPSHDITSPLPYSWQDMVAKPMREGDLEGMKIQALVSAQLNMLHLAHNADSDTVKYNATAFLLSQAGHGPMSRIEHTIDYKKMPADQLKAVIASKLASISRRNPNFDIQGLLSASKDPAIEVTDFVSRETLQEEEVSQEDD